MREHAGRRYQRLIFGDAANRVRRSGVLRGPAIRIYRAAAPMLLIGRGRPILVNSVPKAGTHLLMQMLGGVPSCWYSGRHVDDSDVFEFTEEWPRGFLPGQFEAFLRKIRTGQFATSHVSHAQGAVAALQAADVRHVLLIRDPRDVAISSAHFLAQRRELASLMGIPVDASFEDRLRFVFSGIRAEDGRTPLMFPAAELCARFQPWLTDESTCVVRFEDLVGPEGGGSAAAQLEVVSQVLAFCGRPVTPGQAADIAARTYSSKSGTFREGRLGGWRDLPPGSRELMSTFDPPLLASFGYD